MLVLAPGSNETGVHDVAFAANSEGETVGFGGLVACSVRPVKVERVRRQENLPTTWAEALVTVPGQILDPEIG